MLLWNFFILLQVILLIIMMFHDWLSVYPLNNLKVLNAVHSKLHIFLSTLINSLFVAIPLYLTIFYGIDASSCVKNSRMFFYLGLTIGTILSWWLPYFLGSSERHKKDFKIFEDTHHFLPKRGNNVVPNTLHVILHLFVWSCFLLSIFFI